MIEKNQGTGRCGKTSKDITNHYRTLCVGEFYPWMGRNFVNQTGVCLALGIAGNAGSTTYHGVEFPDGAVSFADAVVDYSPAINTSGQPTSPYKDFSEALGIPDYTELFNCP